MFFTLPDSKGKIMLRTREMERLNPRQASRRNLRVSFVKKNGHMKKDYAKHKAWLEKKGTSFSFVCYELNCTNVNHNT